MSGDEHEERPGPEKRIIIMGNGGRPNVPKSYYVQIDDPMLCPHHGMLVKSTLRGWCVEPLKRGYACQMELDGEPIEHTMPLYEGAVVSLGNSRVQVGVQPVVKQWPNLNHGI
ncbi:hypothetical protein [Magnetococcus marinus]|nr:hypothetical protein [Magnetococcus marinus]